MNLADSEIVRSVLSSAGFEQGEVLEEADLILTNTCAIRENAEAKVWQRLKYFQSLRKANKKRNREAKSKSRSEGVEGSKPDGYPIVGVLGCMAERLKTQLMEKAEVDFIAGPDAYRDLPNLLNVVDSSTDAKAANTALSLEETYADIQPVRLAEGNTHAFVTITRGCNNKCSFCVVPYTRGVERSRPVESILREVTQLREEGYKEVVLLGQNVNSYYFNGETAAEAEDRESGPSLLNVMPQQPDPMGEKQQREKAVRDTNLADGFSQRWKPKPVEAGSIHLGVPFGELLRQVSQIDPEMRIRFQAPHPKDFPDDVLHLIAETPNICNSLHMPAQSGSTTMLERMHRGYTREAYLSLIENARRIIASDTPEYVGLGISSDFISGFCGETEGEHRDTVTMMQQVQFDQAFTYSYSMREQTYAGLFLDDDVPEDVKSRRLTELIDTFQNTAQTRNSRLELGRLHVVLVEGEAKNKGGEEKKRRWTGRTDSNKRVVFPDSAVLLEGLSQQEADVLKGVPVVKDHDDITAGSIDNIIKQMIASKGRGDSRCSITKGSYVIVKISGNRGHTLRGVPIATTTNTRAQQLKL